MLVFMFINVPCMFVGAFLHVHVDYLYALCLYFTLLVKTNPNAFI